MRLITQVEVAYFRSIYKSQVIDCSDTNVIFGRNDSGKSNLLRALNLFFNNETNPSQTFRFDRDFCHSRLAEASASTTASIRKFVYVKIWFKTPSNWKASLGESFWVKKQWNITTESEPSLDYSIENDRNSKYLTRFLNKIKFHYIPAIKDRGIFEKLQAEIYNVISASNEFSGSLRDFSDALRDRTLSLTQELAERLKVKSVVSTPQDLTDLFRSLDFETTSEAGDAYSLTLQRGDGIQVQHIPSILAFISDRSSADYHVWGFEEPENSLELANAIKEAETFRAFGRKNNKQIFLTSHSPAFFSLAGYDVSRYFVSKNENRNERLNSLVTKINEQSSWLPGDLMGELPHLPVISSYLRQAHEEIKNQKEQSEMMVEKISKYNESIVFVEGESDKLLLQAAWEVLYKHPPEGFQFIDGGGTSKMASLSQDGKVLNEIGSSRALFALVDNDAEGRELYKHGRLGDGGVWVRHNSNGVMWCRLSFETGFSDFMRKLNIDKTMWPGCIENLFPTNLRQRAVMDGALALTSTPYSELLNPQCYKKINSHLQHRDDLEHFYVLASDPQKKLSFAEWLIKLAKSEPDIFEPFRGIFDGIISELMRRALH